MKKVRHLLMLSDFSKDELLAMIDLAVRLKVERKKGLSDDSLKGKILAMVFEKSSTRTRVSFEAAMLQMGGHAIYLDTSSSQLGRGETYEDTAMVLARYVDAIVLRTFDQANLERMASVGLVPVINGLSDLYHPVQVLAALQTILEWRGSLESLQVAYVGDGNNLTHSWMEAAKILGFALKVSCPKGYEPVQEVLDLVKDCPGISLVADPAIAVQGVDVIYTDTWFSMGQEVEDQKRKLFQPYQVNEELLARAKEDARVLHCLPAHRDEEITSEVLDGPQSLIFDEAENRLHIQKAILKTLLAS